MWCEIASDVPLDCVIFQILPDNRYGAIICSAEKEEMVADGPLELILEHLPSIKDQIIKGSCDNFKLELPNTTFDRKWFTKATLMRTLHLINSSDALKNLTAISNEIFQLEETRKVHFSLYTQGDKITTSDNSKNELLQAMDSRIAALTEELLSTFKLAGGAAFSFQEMICLKEFCQQFGDLELSNLLMKLSEKSPKGQTILHENNKKIPFQLVSKCDYANKNNGIIQVSGETNSLKSIQYNASPAKAAEIERQSSTGSDESSDASEDDRPSIAERSRTLVRSASPRRSASPMRKVQIGRSGSRRTPALAIRSLPYFPPRERISSCRDLGSDSKSEEAEELSKKTEINETRMSVQDAISLFESRQRDQTAESQKKIGVDSSTNTTKAVLCRWSSGLSEPQKSTNPDKVEPTTTENNTEEKDETTPKSAEVRLDRIPGFENKKFKENMQIDMELEGSKEITKNASEDKDPVNQTEEACEKLDSAEWTSQKEEELKKMRIKFAAYNLSNTKPTNPNTINTKQVSRLQPSGGPSSNCKEKRDEDISGEKSGKKLEKQSAVRAKQRVLDKPKPEKSSPKVSNAVKKLSASRNSILNKSEPISSTANMESLKPSVTRKAPSKTLPLPATRKSWPSTPLPRVTGALTTRSSTTTPPSISSAPRQKSQSPSPYQKPQSPGPVSRPSPKLDKPQVQQKEVKKPQKESKKIVKKVDETKSRVVPINGKTTKIKPAVALKENAPITVSPAKGVVRKVTKKSSVVPLEMKSSVSKVSEKCPVKIPASQKREIIRPKAEETPSKFEDAQSVMDNVGTTNSDKIDLVGVQDSETQRYQHVEQEIESEFVKPENDRENDVSVEAPKCDEVGERIMISAANIRIYPEQESVISPAAWIVSDQQDTTILPLGDNSSSLENPDEVASSAMRVRHSLSQMLLEESGGELDTEWGNAEHLPSMVYQKDAPKGLKRLLKFARKNKELNGAAWASPFTSEGEEDGNEYRNPTKGKTDNLLKVSLQSKNYAEGFLSDYEPLSAHSYASNSSARSQNKFHEGYGSSKGPISFFSLSAFRGKN